MQVPLSREGGVIVAWSQVSRPVSLRCSEMFGSRDDSDVGCRVMSWYVEIESCSASGGLGGAEPSDADGAEPSVELAAADAANVPLPSPCMTMHTICMYEALIYMSHI